GVDTRALTRRLREYGSMRAGIFSGDALAEPSQLMARVLASPPMAGADLVGEVTAAQPYVVPATTARRFRVVALDLGIKFNTPRMLAARGVETHVLPATVAVEELLASQPDGVFLSNGPGDPATADHGGPDPCRAGAASTTV